MKKTLQDNRFNFFVEADIKKGKDDNGKDIVIIDGIASTSSVADSDEETLYPSGFNLLPFLSSGLVNYNHKGSVDANANIGVPLEAKVINGGKDLYVKCMLWPCPQTTGIVTAYEAFKKYNLDRKIGFSIEGRATYKDPLNPKRILKADVTGLAVTFCPKNKNTLMNIVKGEYETAFIDLEPVVKTCPKCDHDQVVNGTCLECGYIESSMDTAAIAPATPEHVEHNPKDISNKNLSNFGGLLKKSDIYIQIAKAFPQTSIAEQKNIFQFIGDVSTKLYKMEVVTTEALQKAFDLLNEATALVKGEQTTTGEQNTVIEKGEGSIDWESDEVKKSLETAKILCKAGMSKEDACDTMCKGGVSAEIADACCSKALAEMQAQQNGGTITTQEAPIMKSEEVAALVSESISKSLNPVQESIQKGFEGLGTIVKSLQESNAALLQQNEKLAQRLEKVEATPNVRKSLSNVAYAERFQKSEDAGKTDENTFNVTSQGDLERLSDRLLVEHGTAIEKGKKEDAALLEGTINAIEISKTVPQFAYQKLAQLGIKLVAPSR